MLFFKKSSLAFVSSLAVFLLISSPAFAANKESSLSPRYRQWLDRDVTYIITSQEKQAFLQLSSDDARDAFIQQFWELRNPTPGAPTNPYRDEIFERIAYANQYFGREGWRSDRGRIYILFGAPQQKARYVGQANIRPMEIWFYSRPHPALPAFFYIVFYQRDAGADFRLYSPYMDGPDKLVTVSGAENNRLAGLQQVDKTLGREVARTTLSLLPDEPVDLDGATSSLTSDVMLGTIRNLANHPFNKDMLEEHRRLLEAVSHRIVLSGEFVDVLTAPLVDGQGNTNLHYVLRLKRPEDFSLQQSKSDQYFFSFSVVARVFTPDKKLIFTQERKLSEFLNAQKVEQVKNKVFGYEGTLPLSPGKYSVEFVLSNDISKTAFREEKQVVIPQPPQTGLQLTAVVPFSNVEAQHAVGEPQPFTASGVKFMPLAGDVVSIAQGRDFQFFYQIWAPPASPSSYGASKLSAEYALGRMGVHDTKTFQDELQKNQFDVNGSLVNGKKIPTADLAPGNYRLAITVSDPATHEKAFTALNLRVVASEPINAAWDVSDPSVVDEARQGVRENQRALCYIAAGNDIDGVRWLTSSYRKNPYDESVRSKLVELLFAKQQFQQVAQLYTASGVSERTDEETILRFAQSLDKLGQVNKSIQLLESTVPSRQSGALYLSLAGYYQRVGDAQRAAEMERKGKTIAAVPPKS